MIFFCSFTVKIFCCVEMCNLNYMHKVNINCDIAESYGNLKIGQDKKVLSYVDAVNIANSRIKVVY